MSKTVSSVNRHYTRGHEFQFTLQIMKIYHTFTLTTVNIKNPFYEFGDIHQQIFLARENLTLEGRIDLIFELADSRPLTLNQFPPDVSSRVTTS